MSEHSIEIQKQSVKELLSTGVKRQFVIPEYQRPYDWNYDQVDTLFNDLWEFTESKGGSFREATYFLGSVVTCDENNVQEIIDGQQRITSLFLLLRAIYTALENGSESMESKNFKQQIRESIWRANKLTGVVDYHDILLTSKVLNNEGNEILRNILYEGKADETAKDNYSKNYIRFQELFKNASMKSPLMVYDFIYALLNQAILLPITAGSQDTALTIFSTLNDRGMPLSDADIFKAKLYGKAADENRDQLISDWKALAEKAECAGESIQQLFVYYMFYLRALEKNSDSTVQGVRKFFLDKEKIDDRLFRDTLIQDLFTIADFRLLIAKGQEIEGETWSTDISILKSLDILTSYPNEYWKYPVIVYYLQYHKTDGFANRFRVFLRELISVLLTRYLIMPTINAVKSDILKLDVKICETDIPEFAFKEIDETQLPGNIITPNKNAVRMMLKLLAYFDAEQTTILPGTWEIEHIFPQKWQPAYFPDKSDDEVSLLVEHIGNKLPFEKSLNIKASNGFFAKKKEQYIKSEVVIARKMTSYADWGLDDILRRDSYVQDSLTMILRQWTAEYENTRKPQVMVSATPEELEMIRKLKERGLI